MRHLIFNTVFLLAASAAAPAMAGPQDYRYGGDYGGSGVVRCESNDGRMNRCAIPYNSGRVFMERQHSRAACIEGRSWGQDRNGIWVDDGCRADFRVGGGYGNYGGYGGYNDYGSGYGQIIRCESDDGRSRRCTLPQRGRAELVRQLSRAACIEGRTWGTNYNSLWVSQGCRGDFRVARDYRGNYGNGYGFGRTFRCESHDGRTRECAANTRAGVQLVRQLSRAACIEGRTWGYGRNGIWVTDGCRAEFRSY